MIKISIINDRIRRMGKVTFSVCPHLGGGGTPVRSDRGGTPTRSNGGGVSLSGLMGGVPQPGLMGVPQPGPTGVPPPGLMWGTPARYPRDEVSSYPCSIKTGQQIEYLIRRGRYASCFHAGGLSCYLGER